MIIVLVLKVVAMSMGIVSIVLGFFPKESKTETHVTLLSNGLVAIAVASLM
jgi:hypothetical protein